MTQFSLIESDSEVTIYSDTLLLFKFEITSKLFCLQESAKIRMYVSLNFIWFKLMLTCYMITKGDVYRIILRDKRTFW